MILRNENTGFLPGHLEGQILSKVNALDNPHLVKVVTSFTYGNEFNIVFRRATTNLEKALREPKYLLEQIVSPLRWSPLWPQMLGLARALHEFSTGRWRNTQSREENGTTSVEAESAIHFDIKPSNVLVDRSSRVSPKFNFVITDFGLAHIKTTEGSGSGTHDRGGDDAYAPPEIMLPTQNRKYDIWSLGCIFLEIVTFLVRGYQGVRSLDDVRRQTLPNRTRQAPCFWEQSPQSGTYREDALENYRLKESVEGFIDSLRSRADTIGRYSPRERLLINNTLDMIQKMLVIKPADRLTSAELVWLLERVGMPPGQSDTLQHILDTRTDDYTPESAEPTVAPAQINNQFWWESLAPVDETIHYANARDNESELEPHRLRRLPLLVRSNDSSSDEDSKARLQVFTSERNFLRFVVIFTNLNERGPPEQTCPRRQVHLMPQYAFRKDHTTDRSDAGIRFVWKDHPRQPIMRYDISGKLDDLRVVHSVLLNQEVYHTVEVNDVQIRPPHSRFRRAPKWFRRTPKWSEDLGGETGPFTVQLWREKREKLRACRIVVYFSTIICVLPFHQYLRLPDNDTMMRQPESTFLESSTVEDTKQSQTFEMVVLRSTDTHEALPTFPLDTDDLDDILTEQPVSYKRFSVDFRASEDLIDFWKAYRVLKNVWLRERGITA